MSQTRSLRHWPCECNTPDIKALQVKYRTLVCISVCFLTIVANGCFSLRAKDDFSSLKEPVTYQMPAEQKTKPAGFAGKVKSAYAHVIGGILWSFMQVGAATIEDRLDVKEDNGGFDPDPLWHQGYGFENPNSQRIRDGNPVKNFDGTLSN